MTNSRTLNVLISIVCFLLAFLLPLRATLRQEDTAEMALDLLLAAGCLATGLSILSQTFRVKK